MAHDETEWDRYLPDPAVDYRAVTGTPVRIGPEADNQIPLQLAGGPTLFLGLDRTEDPRAPGTVVELQLDWTRLPGPPASGITPLLVAWTPGGGVLQLAPEEPDPGEVAPGMRILGGPELVLRVPPAQVRTWIARLLSLPRRDVLDRRGEQLVWLGDLDPAGRLLLQRIVRTDRCLVVQPAGTAEADRLAPPSAFADLDPRLRARLAGSTRVYGPQGHLSAELYAVESERGPDGTDRTVARVHAMAGRWGRPDVTIGRPTWRNDDGPSRWWMTVHESPDGCPIPVEVPELAGAAWWVECGRLLPSPPPARSPAHRRRHPGDR